MPRVIVATGNRGKLEEIRSALDLPGWEFVTASDLGSSTLDIEETGDTFEENARLKAQAYKKAFGLPALADDSGLEVDALGGEPGVRSSRYAGPDATDAENNAKLMAALEGVPEGQRGARFRTVIVYVDAGAPRSSWTARARAPSGSSRTALAASVTIPCSCRRKRPAARWLILRWPRRTRSVTAAQRCARCGTRSPASRLCSRGCAPVTAAARSARMICPVDGAPLY